MIGCVALLFAGIVTAPDPGGKIRRIADKPQVLISGGSSGLSGNRYVDPAQFESGSGTGIYDILHRACKKESG